MEINASVEAFASCLRQHQAYPSWNALTFAMSLYKLNGQLIPSMKSTIIARLSVSSHKNFMCCRLGNKAVITCGMVSPTIMQNATMPPNAKAH